MSGDLFEDILRNCSAYVLTQKIEVIILKESMIWFIKLIL